MLEKEAIQIAHSRNSTNSEPQVQWVAGPNDTGDWIEYLNYLIKKEQNYFYSGNIRKDRNGQYQVYKLIKVLDSSGAFVTFKQGSVE
jgi:hypothetical protein